MLQYHGPSLHAGKTWSLTGDDTDFWGASTMCAFVIQPKLRMIATQASLFSNPTSAKRPCSLGLAIPPTVVQ